MQTDSQTKAPSPLIERLFKAGAHFGFTKSRRHPSAQPFIFGSKQGTDIIDLEKTGALLETAKTVLEEAGKTGKTVLFVGTKEEIRGVVKNFAERASMPFVTNRWIGGILTNFPEIRKRISRLFELTEQGESGELERKYTKKERVIIGRELEKLTFNFDGIKSITRTPNLVVVIDPRHEAIAVREALQMNIPVIALSSSDANIRSITYPIVANDALQSSVSLILEELTASLMKGAAEFVPPKREETNRRER